MRLSRRVAGVLIALAAQSGCWSTALGAARASVPELAPCRVLGNGHKGMLTGLACRPDGRVLASASNDGTIKLWDLAAGLCTATMGGHGKGDDPLVTPPRVECIAFSPDGKSVAAGNSDGTTKLWDVVICKCVATFGEPHPFGGPSNTRIAFSPDGKIVASGYSDGSVRLWHVGGHANATVLIGPNTTAVSVADRPRHAKATIPTRPDNAKPRKFVSDNWVASLAFSRDGAVLVSVALDGKIRFWDVATGKGSGEIDAPHGGAISAAFSRGGKLLASGNLDGTITTWDFRTRAENATLARTSHHGTVSVSFSPDGKTLLALGAKPYAELWSASSGLLVEAFADELLRRAVTCAIFNPDGKTVIDGDHNGRIGIWDIASGDKLATLGGHSDAVGSVAFSPDGKLLASVGGGGVKVWQVATGRNTKQFENAAGATAVFSPDGTMLAVYSIRYSPSVSVWAVAGWRRAAKFATDLDHGMVGFAADGKSVLSPAPDGTVTRWVIATGETEVRRVARGAEWKGGVYLSPDCRKALGLVEDKRIARVFDLASGNTVGPAIGIGGVIERAAFSNDGRALALSGDDNKVKVWSVGEGKVVATLSGADGMITHAEPSPDGTMVAFDADKMRAAQLWDVRSGEAIARLVGHQGSLACAAFSPDGKLLATGTWDDGNVLLWDIGAANGGKSAARHP